MLFLPAASMGFPILTALRGAAFAKKITIFHSSDQKMRYHSGLVAASKAPSSLYVLYIYMVHKTKISWLKAKITRPLKPERRLGCKTYIFYISIWFKNPRKLTFCSISLSCIFLLPIAQPGSFGCDFPKCTPDCPICFGVIQKISS